MDEISNKTLAILLISAIVVSLGGTLISLNRLAMIRAPITGFATVNDTATVALEISSLAQVNFTVDSINWGTGTVTAGFDFCVLDTMQADLTGNCTGFSPANGGGSLVLENIGNKNITLNMYTGKTAEEFIGAPGAEYQFNVSDKEANSCGAGSWNITQGVWQDAQTTNLTICNETDGGFRAESGNDELYIDVRVLIPDTASGAKSDTITADIAQI